MLNPTIHIIDTPIAGRTAFGRRIRETGYCIATTME